MNDNITKYSGGYPIDNDTAFKSACRKHQAWFRKNILQLPMGKNIRTHRTENETDEAFEVRRNTVTDIAHLTDEDASKLMNFVPSFSNEIKLELINRYGKVPTSHDLMNDMLRSECIPWNLFVPMMCSKDTAVLVLRLIIKRSDIQRIDDFKIEYNPHTLEDNTAFDAYFKYTTKKGEVGIIGIETKYTEDGYKISNKEAERINSPYSSYCVTMRNSGFFNTDDAHCFNNPDYIQIWRNHLLAISLRDKESLTFCDSVTIYPSGNDHFNSNNHKKGALECYKEFLSPEGKRTFHYLTIEDFVEIIKAFYQDERNKEWVEYINDRYVQNTCIVDKIDNPRINEDRKEWVLNLDGFRLNDMISSGEAKANFTSDAPFASQYVSDKTKYLHHDVYIKAYNEERGSTHDSKNNAFWNFCRKVECNDIIYLAEGPRLFAYGIVTGSHVETNVEHKQHLWKVDWHLFPTAIEIDPHIATPFFVELSDKTGLKKKVN